MTYATVTTMNQEYFDNIGYQMIESYIKYWPKNINLYVYTENFTLPYNESNVIGLDIFEKCNPNLQKFINGSRKNITRKFSYKAYSWMHACKNLTEDTLIWLDADTETIQNVDTKCTYILYIHFVSVVRIFDIFVYKMGTKFGQKTIVPSKIWIQNDLTKSIQNDHTK